MFDGHIRITVGIGTVIDNYLILKLKQRKLSDQPQKILLVDREIAEYTPLVKSIVRSYPEILKYIPELRSIHIKLWNIEDRKRIIENDHNEMGLSKYLLNPRNVKLLREYLGLACKISVYNDRRAAVKAAINKLTKSFLQEVKSYGDLK